MKKYDNNNYIYAIMILGVLVLGFVIVMQNLVIRDIRETNYEFCYQGTCYYQKIGDYLDGKE